MAAVLRCADHDSASGSVARLYGVTVDAIYEALPRAAIAAQADGHQPSRALPEALAAVLGAHPDPPSVITYFHGTRVADPRRFAVNGLQSLNRVLDDIWCSVVDLAAESVARRRAGASR
jgi:hypothetical protein